MSEEKKNGTPRSRAGGSGVRPAGPGAGGGAVAAMARPVTPGRIALYVLLLIGGVLVAPAGALLQAAWFPGGLLLALAGLTGLLYGGGRATETVSGVLVPGAAWLVTVFLLLGTTRPEGDFLFGAGLGSYLFLLGGILVAVICATVAQRRALGAPPGRAA
ncbi:DUF6113 family protein [Streptomyces sp. NPDC014733]|uniref:DUF6113 family protein n=1 Tax=Streptomyces sp. NPDC014733 TaxID=3364885 RepID=UPI0036F979BB